MTSTITLNYIKIGKGYPVLILHGLFGLSDNWLTFGKKLAEKNHISIILPDLRNHGNSFHSDEMDYFSMANDIKNLLLKENIQNSIIIGHSMGGKVAMISASVSPSFYSAICVLDIAPIPYSHENIYEIIKVLSSFNVEKIKNREELNNILKNYNFEQPLINLFQKNLKREKNNSFSWKFNIKAIINNIEKISDFPEISPINIHTLFIKGEFSNFINHQAEEKIKIFFPLSKTISIPNAGHWLHVDNFDYTLNIVSDFITNVLKIYTK